MDPALEILDRALKGDKGALTFLERTVSIYVYDGTNRGQPKLCGSWDFLNQSLTEIERYESRVSSSSFQLMSQQGNIGVLNLEGHVQLLAKMSLVAAKRCPASDQKLVEVCLANAAHYQGSFDQAQHLIANNFQMRKRVMGRIAAIAFDHSHHHTSHSYQSAFSNPITIDSLCAIVACNAIATGPGEFVNLVTEWIIPCKENLPLFSVVAVTYHLASEAMGKSSPVGTRDALKNKLFVPVMSKVLAPLLMESVRESDVGNRFDSKFTYGKGGNHCHRVVAMTLKAMERWSTATVCSLLTIKKICQNSNVNIVEVISDALYSDSELVLDSLVGLFETLLRCEEQNNISLNSFAITGRWITANIVDKSESSCFNQFEQDIASVEKEREEMMVELVSGIGLQRLRFGTRLDNADSGVCRCLASIAKSIAISSKSIIRSGRMKGREDGMIELLLKAASHSSLYVCGIALEAFQPLITSGSPLAMRLLTTLQGKAIVPQSLVGMNLSAECPVDFPEFQRFREYQLSGALLACYMSNRSYYIESCASAVEEFCASTANPQLPYQLEAALFCLSAVAMDASKWSLLLTLPPIKRIAAAKAYASEYSDNSEFNESMFVQDSKRHDEQLARCIRALAKVPTIALSNSLTLAQMCRFIGKYANWLSKTPSEGVLEASASLALTSFDTATLTFIENKEDFSEIIPSPFTEAATALRNILNRSPQRFATAEALSALERGWKSVYDVSKGVRNIGIDDRKTLCSGISRVVAVLPSDQRSTSLSALVNPTFQCIETVTKITEGLVTGNGGHEKANELISRMSEEIYVLATILRTFYHATSNNGAKDSIEPILTILRRVWPFLTHIAQKYGSNTNISFAIGDFLLVAISMEDRGLLKVICDVAIQVMNVVSESNNPTSLVPMMEFIVGTLSSYGQIADIDVCSSVTENTISSAEEKEVRNILECLIHRCFEIIQPTFVPRSDQGIGQNPLDSTVKMDVVVEKKYHEAVAGLFSVCTSCVQKCPLLFLTLKGRHSDSEDDGFFPRSVGTAVAWVGDNDANVSRASMLFLKEVFQLSKNGKDQHKTDIASLGMQRRNEIITSKVDKLTAFVRGTLISTLIYGACGMFPREALDPAADLLHSVLQITPSEEAGRSVIAAVQKESFVLGEQARNATIITLGKCTQAATTISLLMELFEDLWELHQNDDAGGSVSGSDAVVQFTQKYGQ